MRHRIDWRSGILVAVAALVAGTGCATSTPVPTGPVGPEVVAGDSVDCQLPARVRRRGRGFTTIVSGDVVRVSPAECGERGGFAI